MHKILVAALFAAAAAGSFRDRLKTIQAEATAQREKLNLPRDKLYAQYPTPEMTFRGEPPSLACGQSAPLSLSGHFPKGTQLVLHSDDAGLTDVKLTATTAQATLHVEKTALPGPLQLEAVAPVSGANTFRQVALVDEKLRVSLKFEDGWTATLDQLQANFYDVAWSKAGKTRESHAQVDADEGGLRINVEASPEQQALVQEQVAQAQENIQDPDYQAVQKAFAACNEAPKGEQMHCIEKAAAQAQVLGDRMKRKQEEQAKALEAKQPREAWACRQITLRGRGGQLAGTAQCFAEQKVTARVECLGR